MDNLEEDPDVENRCHEIVPDNVRRQILKENIISHINRYDYEAAHQLVQSNPLLFDAQIQNLIKAAALRKRQETSEAIKLFQTAGVEKLDLFLGDSTSNLLMEYGLILQLKLQNKVSEPR